MLPELFRIGPISLHSFGFMMAVGFLVASYLIRREFQRIGESGDLAYELVISAAVGGIVGAKVYYLIKHWSFVVEDPLGMVFSGAGLVWYGGLIGGVAAVIWWLHYRRKSVGKIGNIVAPHLALGQAFGRIGCLLVGDDYGVPSSLPWAVAFPRGVPPTTDSVHPTQIYEALLLFGIFLLLRAQLRRDVTNWFVVYGYCLLAGMQRLLIEFIRTNEVVAVGLTLAQFFSIALIMVGAVGMFQLRRSLAVPRTVLGAR